MLVMDSGLSSTLVDPGYCEKFGQAKFECVLVRTWILQDQLCSVPRIENAFGLTSLNRPA